MPDEDKTFSGSLVLDDDVTCTHSVGNGSQLKAMCNVATILMNGQLESHFQRQPKPSPFTTHPMNDPTPNALLQIMYYKPAAV